MNRQEYAKLGEAGDASGMKVGVVASRFNADITDALLEGALMTLKEWKVAEEDITVLRVPGSFEVPFGAKLLIDRGGFDAVVALGCLIKGETKHDEYIANAVAEGIMRVELKTGVPVSFGIITTNDLAQAKERSTGETNKGSEAAAAALSLALLKRA
ncbi:MAG: 6,7-dimethyl-8-ribityllumazine synthase [Patescibacteria group bacterium]|nr:6,7-dimethyl-8-ribityllumazine synthase [Patescibacteria group bacterium]MDE1965870.1 6,7-dimethyl-8-ribityllumazine synthase [Patescibacteria group bacterium]